MSSDFPAPISPRISGVSTVSAQRLPSSDPKRETFDAVLRRVGTRIDQGERMASRVAAGPADLDAGQALALQVGIYRYAEAVELVGKVLDKGCSAVKTTLQSGQ